jgi:hypothetical protein
VKLSTDLNKAELGVGELISYLQVLCDKYGSDTPVLGMLADGGGEVVRLKICGIETAEFSEDGKMKIRIFCEEEDK